MYLLFIVLIYFFIKYLRRNKIKEIRNPESKTIWSRVPKDVRKIVHTYMKNINKPLAWSKLSTDSFIKEVYYATTKDRLNTLLTINHMVQVIKETNKQRKKMKKFEIDDFRTLDFDRCYIGVRRYDATGDTSRVTYLLTQASGNWKFDHITRDCKGTIVEKLPHKQKIIYVISTQGMYMFFAVPKHEDRHQLNDLVYVDGYLEVEDTYHDDFYYLVHNIVSIQ
ncbi:hypothetical protein [Paenibacillus roseipurpureus]|uniref:Uncharacterized protein n=1 Tax=Paenibacillus roseopurpureus TaxID=2918901 RepID=A0AA96LU93_9BACL|nr:hypothetical protein [Paenibacillus sp. MBLB1832]WNR46601.1 hypothetical protein MJB10_11080 [Paenibacillus sp. MBLB1832]